eukprot:72360_1
MALSASFYIYSSLLPLFPLGCFLYFILQIIIAKYSIYKFNDKATLILLLLVYLSGVFCGIAGYSMHIIPSDSIWCETYGMGVCFAFLGGTKSFLYGYFLRRAKTTVIPKAKDMTKLSTICFNIVIPIYIIIYYLIYCSITSLFFKGTYYNLNFDQYEISFCAFKSWKGWFVIVASCIDLFNSFVAITAFVYPLFKLMKLEDNKDIKILNTMKWNAVLSFVATLSSALTLFMIPVAEHYIWLFCLGDPFINASCCFFMMAANRDFCSCSCSLPKNKANIAEKHVTQMELHSSFIYESNKSNSIKNVVNNVPSTDIK